MILSLVLVVACTLLHYESLKLLNDYLPRAALIEKRAKVLAALVGAMSSHLSQIMLFAGAYHLLRDNFGLGGFGGTFKETFASLLYFSIETYTSLGLGDIYPTGSLRLVTGIEALTGLLLIGWTASFSYLEMLRYWEFRTPEAAPDPASELAVGGRSGGRGRVTGAATARCSRTGRFVRGPLRNGQPQDGVETGD